MKPALVAYASGLWAVLRAPVVLAFVCLVTLLIALPFALVVGADVRAALANQPAIDLAAQEIDAEWWMEYRRHASGLASTFVPAIIGFAAPLENISALLDGTSRTPALALPVVSYALVWALLWGGLLHRFAQGAPVGVSQAWSVAMRHFPRFAVISAGAGAMVLVLFLTVHRIMFGPVFAWIEAFASSEPSAFAGRVVLYLVFGMMLASVSLVADYSRIALVASPVQSLRAAIGSAVRFMRDRFAAVAVLFVLSATVFALALAAYGLADTRFGGWRGVVLGQLFIVARLALRLTAAAAQVALWRRLTG